MSKEGEVIFRLQLGEDRRRMIEYRGKNNLMVLGRERVLGSRYGD